MIESGAALPAVDVTDAGGRQWSLGSVAQPAVLVFFKVDCATSRAVLPVLAQWKGYGPRVSLLAISQDPPEATSRFLAELDIRMELAYDPAPYPASAAFDLEAVPAWFLVEADRIRFRRVGWHAGKAGELAALLAGRTGHPPILVGADALPPFQPG